MYQSQFSQGKFISRKGNLHSKNKIFITILIYKTILSLFVLFIHASQLFIRFSRSGLGKCRLLFNDVVQKVIEKNRIIEKKIYR